MKYRKKTLIEAVRMNDLAGVAPREYETLPSWYRAWVEQGKVHWTNDGLYLDTLEGRMHASWGDWVACGAQGELYAIKPDIFAETYEAVGDDA